MNGFEGGMTAKKYMAITKTCKATANRDLFIEFKEKTGTGGGEEVQRINTDFYFTIFFINAARLVVNGSPDLLPPE